VNKLDQIIVIDIEATCWDSSPPEGEENEIIEVGICTLDIQTWERLERKSILVKPEKSAVGPFCTELTGITQAMVDEGVTFAKACGILRNDYFSRRRVWASYGDYDRKLFEKQCTARQIKYPFGSTHINIKNLYAIMNGLNREIGLYRVLEQLKLPFEGKAHRGHYDAWNAAVVLAKLMDRNSNQGDNHR
jgi:inhibitor of KinA sporulation pathway (predicted exonuclease)